MIFKITLNDRPYPLERTFEFFTDLYFVSILVGGFFARTNLNFDLICLIIIRVKQAAQSFSPLPDLTSARFPRMRHVTDC